LDQRGSGRTFAKNGAAGVTREKLVADGIDLAEQLHKRFPRAPVIPFGHSWGSIIATGMVQQRPDLFAAYVGTGQVTAWADVVQFQFDFLKTRYREKGDTAALGALEAIVKPDPRNVQQYFAFSRPIRQNMNASDTAWLTGLLEAYKASGETEEALKAIGDGSIASARALIDASVATNFPETATSFKLPYYVIQGRHDLFAPTPLVEGVLQQSLGAEETSDHHRRCRPLRAGHAPGVSHCCAEGDSSLSAHHSHQQRCTSPLDGPADSGCSAGSARAAVLALQTTRYYQCAKAHHEHGSWLRHGLLGGEIVSGGVCNELEFPQRQGDGCGASAPPKSRRPALRTRVGQTGQIHSRRRRPTSSPGRHILAPHSIRGA
jgi:pimeloyl-ACP methyl ester carboxylesterase